MEIVKAREGEPDDWARALDAVEAERRIAERQIRAATGGHLCPNCHTWTPGQFDFDAYVFDRTVGLCATCLQRDGESRRKIEPSSSDRSNLVAAMSNTQWDAIKAGRKRA